MIATTRTLRPILFAIVFFFVILPLLVYNFVTLDYRIAKSNIVHVTSAFLREHKPATEVDGTSINRCLNVPSDEFLTLGGIEAIQKDCQPNAEMSRRNDEGMVHFVHVPLEAVPILEGEEAPASKDQFTYLNFAAVQSVRKFVKPSVMLLHYITTEPRGVWYTQCQRHLSLHRVIAPSIATAKSLNVYQRQQLMEFLVMLRVLRNYGGVAFSDFNTIVVRSTFQELKNLEIVASQSLDSIGNIQERERFSMGVHTLQASVKYHPYIVYLETTLLEMIANDDPMLRDLPLDQVIGELTLQKAQLERQQQANNSSVTNALVLDGVVVGSSDLFEHVHLKNLKNFVTGSLSDAQTGKNLRRATAFHLHQYDFEQKTTDNGGIRELNELNDQLTTAEAWQNQQTLFGAIVRFVVNGNTTAELDPYLNG